MNYIQKSICVWKNRAEIIIDQRGPIYLKTEIKLKMDNRVPLAYNYEYYAAVAKVHNSRKSSIIVHSWTVSMLRCVHSSNAFRSSWICFTCLSISKSSFLKSVLSKSNEGPCLWQFSSLTFQSFSPLLRGWLRVTRWSAYCLARAIFSNSARAEQRATCLCMRRSQRSKSLCSGFERWCRSRGSHSAGHAHGNGGRFLVGSSHSFFVFSMLKWRSWERGSNRMTAMFVRIWRADISNSNHLISRKISDCDCERYWHRSYVLTSSTRGFSLSGSACTV